jgi:serralysin
MTGTAKTIVAVTATGNELTDGVLYGYAWSGAITYSFPTLASDYSYTNESSQDFAAATVAQKNAALAAIEQSFGTAANDGFSVEGFTNLSVSAGSTKTSTLRFAQSDAPSTAYAYMPGNYAQAGDMWFGRNYDYTNAKAGNYAYHTVLHEIGHALGLKHGHEASGNFAALPSQYDSLETSVMTYRAHVGSDLNGYTYGEWSAPQTYMIADIAALQKMYGADFSTNNGATTYRWQPTDGDTYVNGKIAIDAGGSIIFATIWDGGGVDTYDLKAYTTDLQIDLTAGGHSSFGAAQLADLGDGYSASGSIYNALQFNGDARSLIENAIGGAGNDTIIGNVANNTLTGNDGNDTLSGLDGNDYLLGGGGNDTLLLGGGNNKADGGIGNDTISAGIGNDTIIGGLGDDLIQASDGNNTIDGGDGNDAISTGIGNDTITGGLGNDILQASDGINKIDGGAGNDTIIGGSGADTIIGGVGDDVVQAGNGANNITGGDGNDQLTGGTDIDKIGGGNGNDVIYSLGGNDTITGDAGNDIIYSGDGNDAINGGAGIDRLIGGGGDNALTGGTDADTFVFSLQAGVERITDFANGVDKIELDGFDLSSAADLVSHAAQVGKDLLITLADSETLTLVNFKLASLDTSDFLLVA